MVFLLEATSYNLRSSLGLLPDGLEPPCEFPDLLGHIWAAFLVLSRQRQQGFSGPQPISFQDMIAWKELHKSHLSPRDFEVIELLDRIYLGVAYG